MSEPPKNSQRIAKLLARAGVASRREIERMIEERRIAIDGVPLETPATIVTSLKGITVDGNPVAAAEPTRLFRYHKPTGLLTAERDMKGRATIYDKLPPDMPRTVPVGRLDLNTEGLLLMTTDGALKRRLELPSTGVPRSYRARAYGPVTQAQLEELIHGIEIDGVRYGQIDANLERRTGTNVWIEMTLKEGKNREVRRVLEHLGLRVSRLIRTRYGPFALEDLPPGEVEEVKQHELVEFLKELGNAEPQPTPEPGIKGTALRKHWRITPSKVVRPSFPSPSRGEGDSRGARRGEGRAASAAQNTPIPKYRPDPVERPRTPAPARPPATTATDTPPPPPPPPPPPTPPPHRQIRLGQGQTQTRQGRLQKMRIISGNWRGRPLIAPKGTETRPTADRTREGLFSMLVSRLGSFEGLRVLDLFAGSGALGLEALSRGAGHCTFVEQDSAALDVLRTNIAKLSAAPLSDVRAQSVMALGPAIAPYDLVLLDPPYRSGAGVVALERCLRLGWLAPGALVTVETAKGEAVTVEGFEVEAERVYGKAMITVLRVAT